MAINFGPSPFRAPIPTILKKSPEECLIFHELFGYDNTVPVNFFYRLPEHVRKSYEELYALILPNEDRLCLLRNLTWCHEMLRGITPEKYKLIVATSGDETYYSFYQVYQILQPTIETIINANNLYDEFPECLI